ncbi:MAG: hypothetical protein AAFQ62_09590 [Pseudomonadota bacterium]
MTHASFIRMTALAALTALALVLALTGGPSQAQSDGPQAADTSDDAMTVDRIETIIERLDEDYERNGNSILFSFAERQILLVSDPEADRMRIMIPVNDAAALDPEELMRLMQANFDSALDARYAIANGTLWSTFLHRLSTLTEIDLLSGIGQTINTADSFGTSYSSGEFVFGGGDSGELQRRKLIDELQRRGRETI